MLFYGILALNLQSKQISLQIFLYFKLPIYPPDVKRAKCFRGFTCHDPLTGLCHEPFTELTAPPDPHLHFTTLKNSIFVQKWTLVKLFG